MNKYLDFLLLDIYLLLNATGLYLSKTPNLKFRKTVNIYMKDIYTFPVLFCFYQVSYLVEVEVADKVCQDE